MAHMDWGMVCSVPNDGLLPQLNEFGCWFVQRVHHYGIRSNQIYNFTENPDYVVRLSGNDEGVMRQTYERLCKQHPNVCFVLHILPHKNSSEFDKLKLVTNTLQLVGQGVLVDNALKRFAGADEAAVFHNVNQYIARRFAQIVEFKHESKAQFLIKHAMLPLRTRSEVSYSVDDIQSTISTALHADQVTRMAQTQSESKCFRQSAIASGLPEHYTRFQLAALFSRWPLASLLITSRGCAFVDFIHFDGPYSAKAHFDAHPYHDEANNSTYHIIISPVQSRYLRLVDTTVKAKDASPTQQLVEIKSA